ADRNRSHWSTSKTPSYTKSVSWQHHRWPYNIALALLSGCISDTQKFLIQYSFDWYLFVTQLYFFAR
ncbi:hypothetical protein, partial [Escherichia coli]|uniref:hypothetical protein n=1 Tax=Escherichia coli TaxID=562 RepID=UPI001BC86941